MSHSTGADSQSCDIPTQRHDKSFGLLSTDNSEVESIILNLKNDSAVGSDGISSYLLKMVRKSIVPSLTYIFNLCFETGVFPLALKHSLVHPIHKSGSRTCVNNYRPISVLPALSKVLEKLINKRLTGYLEKHKLLADSQYGFRAGKSTEHAVVSLVDYIVSNLDKKRKCISIFLDLAKAFDTVSIPLLLNKMENIGIRGLPLQLFKDYLSNRSQSVVINEFTSSSQNITYGVPQGSILGPSLFLIYINELCLYSPNNGQVFSYADDTALVYQGATWVDVQIEAERGLEHISRWLKQNQLTLNIAKSKYMAYYVTNVSQPPPSHTIKFHTCSTNSARNTCSCVSLEKVVTIKYLGLTLDNRLTWTPQSEVLSTRLRKLIWIFKRLRNIASPELLRTIYFALCQSIIGYCIPVWGGTYKSTIIKVERAQRSILKVMHNFNFRYPTKALFEHCKLLTVRQLFISRIALYQHSITVYDPSVLANKRTTSNVTKRKQCSSAFAGRQFTFLGPYLYDKLNKNIDIYPKTKFCCKKSIETFLLGLDYLKTESLLVVTK